MSWRELVTKGFSFRLVLFQWRSGKPEGLVWLLVCSSGPQAFDIMQSYRPAAFAGGF